MFSRMGSDAFKKDLTNIKTLCEHLCDPHKKFRSIHIGGTNGKGSVSHMLASVLQSSSYKTGLYTSPHLYDFRERIRINGLPVTEEFVIEFVERIKPLAEEIRPSFFEITVAMAFEYFALQKVDIAVVEVGLGGRLDSTNIITPELSVITNIGWDHMNMLGNSLEEIAMEKAGIIKENVPVVIGEKNKTTENIFRKVAEEKNAPIFFAEDEFSVSSFSISSKQLQVNVQQKDGKQTHYELDLPGIYQTKNILTTLEALQVLRSSGFGIENVQKALSSVKKRTGLSGRWEVIHNKPTVVLEVAHNIDGISQLLKHLQNLQFNRLHMIMGMVKDKEISSILEILPHDAMYYFTQAHIPRALEANFLKEEAEKHSLKGNVFADVNEAVQNAIQNASPNDLVIVCGSIFLVAEVNRELIFQLT